MDVNISALIKNKIYSNKIILIFPFIGFILALFKFELNIESYASLFITMATILATLTGFIGIFIIFILQNNHAQKSYYVTRIDFLKDNLNIYPISFIAYKKEEIQNYISKIDENIDKIDTHLDGFDFSNGQSIPFGISELRNKYTKDRQIFIEIKYILKQILDLTEEDNSEYYYKNFLFIISIIFIFTIAIALCKIYVINENLTSIFDNWRFINMPLTGFLFGLYFISLKDLADMLKQFFHFPK